MNKTFDYEKVYDFSNLYRAYTVSRLGKRTTAEVIRFEMNAGANLCYLQEMQQLAAELHLEFNSKTQIFPISQGVEYLGWRFGLTESGAVTRKKEENVLEEGKWVT